VSAQFQYVEGQARPGFAALLAGYEADGRAAVAQCAPRLDVPYGTQPRQTLDLFTATGPARGALLYLHAGYWQSRDKALFRFLAPGLAALGLHVALANYPLCPSVTLDALTEAVREAVPAVLRETGGALPLVVAGHSAGAHLAVELALTDWPARGLPASPIAAVIALSGIYELTPLVDTTLNANLRLDAAAAARRSPVRRVRGGLPPALFAVGGDETPAFLEQNRDMHAAWQAAGNAGTCLAPDGDDHFSLLRTWISPDAALHRHTRALIERACPAR